MQGSNDMKVMVTGGSGFIGSAVCRHLVRDLGVSVVNIDKLTYAASPGATAEIARNPLYSFHRLDICDRENMLRVMREEKVDAVMHLAAESHVDRSIDGPGEFVQTNVVGTFSLLEEARAWWGALPAAEKEGFRFLHVSTDEVYGTLGPTGLFAESTPYAPNSPYAASKAAADHFVRAYHETFGLPVLITNCSNNYGPYQFPEKLIPLFIANLLRNEPVPVYGNGLNVRDWIHVRDHCAAIDLAWRKGKAGEVYNIGGRCEKANLDLTHTLLDLMGKPKTLIRYVQDRPGHDRRYAIDASKIRRELGWQPTRSAWPAALEQTVRWYVDHQDWWRRVKSGAYRDYYERQYLQRV
jgi:dTDP-glucose 4,6-dehydratase